MSANVVTSKLFRIGLISITSVISSAPSTMDMEPMVCASTGEFEKFAWATVAHVLAIHRRSKAGLNF